MQILFAKWQPRPRRGSILNCSKIPLTTVREWMDAEPGAALYRFALEDLYRQQEHVLDDKGERLLSLSSRFASSPNDAYAALSTADVKYPSVHALAAAAR